MLLGYVLLLSSLTAIFCSVPSSLSAESKKDLAESPDEVVFFKAFLLALMATSKDESVFLPLFLSDFFQN